MKKIFLAVVSSIGFLIIASCANQKITGSEKVNQYNKSHQKSGYWVETDTITFAEFGILNPRSVQDNYYRHGNPHLETIPEPPQSIQWGNTTPYFMISKGEYKNDQKNGEWKYCIKDTIVVKKVFYNCNAIDSMFLYNQKGKLILEGRTDWIKDEFVYKKYGDHPSSGKFPLYFLSSNKNWNWIMDY